MTLELIESVLNRIAELIERVLNRIAMLVLNISYRFCLPYDIICVCVCVFAAIILWALSLSELPDIPVYDSTSSCLSLIVSL